MKLYAKVSRLFPYRLPVIRVLFGGLAILMLITTGWLVLRAFATPSVGQTTRTLSWPPFTMTYTVRDVDPESGELMWDQTWRAVVIDNYAWRTDLLRDSVKPTEVGSYRELKNGVLREYNATYKQTNEREIGLNATTPITVELALTTRIELTGGGGRMLDSGWAKIAAAPGRIAFLRRGTQPCLPERARPLDVPTPRDQPPANITRPQAVATSPVRCAAGPTTVPTEYRIEFDEKSMSDTFNAGIAVYGEQRVNGVPVHTFRAESLDIQWPAPSGR